MSTNDRGNRLFSGVSRVLALRDRIWDRERRRHGLRDVSWAQGELLAALERAGGRLQVQDLAERSGRGKSTASTLVAKLSRRGLIFKMRVTGDGRGAWVVLTEKGRRVSRKFDQMTRMVERSCWSDISSEERLAAGRTLAQIENNLKRGGAS